MLNIIETCVLLKSDIESRGLMISGKNQPLLACGRVLLTHLFPYLHWEVARWRWTFFVLICTISHLQTYSSTLLHLERHQVLRYLSNASKEPPLRQVTTTENQDTNDDFLRTTEFCSQNPTKFADLEESTT